MLSRAFHRAPRGFRPAVRLPHRTWSSFNGGGPRPWTWSAEELRVAAVRPGGHPPANSSVLCSDLVMRLTRCKAQLHLLAILLPDKTDLPHLISLYDESIADLRVTFTSDTTRLSHLVQRIYNRHDADVASALLAMQLMPPLESASFGLSLHDEGLHDTLQAFFWERLGFRTVLRDYIGNCPTRGRFALNCNPLDVAQRCARASRALCAARFGQAPHIIITSNNMSGICKCPSTVLTYILCELLKNSCRATVEHHAGGFDDQSPDDTLPPVRCHISFGHEDVHVLISDNGGGIPEDHLPKVWQFLYSSCRSAPWARRASNLASMRFGHAMGQEHDELAGYGIGLPMSRLYARYFGGDVTLKSERGSGTEATVRLRRTSPFSQPVSAIELVSDCTRWSRLATPSAVPPVLSLIPRNHDYLEGSFSMEPLICSQASTARCPEY